MNNNLIVNPFTQFFFTQNEDEDYLLIAPKPGNGLQHLEIIKSELPHLHEVLLDLSKIKLDFLDVENDITSDERELLYQFGILVEAENIPHKPLFACSLNEVEDAGFDDDLSFLRVNPTFRLEFPNLTDFSTWIQEKHLSPYQPLIWIKTPVTEIEIGYWLNAEQAEVVSKFTAGEELSFEIDKNLLSKLIAAEILISSEIHRRKEEICRQTLYQAKEYFRQNKYTVLHALLPPVQMKAMRNYYREYIKQGFMPFGDSQVNRRYYQHNEPLARLFHRNLTKLMSLVAGEEVKPSYVYAASYKEGASLQPHVDRQACEFSFSFQVDYQPEQENHLSPWALYLSTKKLPSNDLSTFEWEDFPPESNSEDIKAVYLASGDSLVYKGCELVHYRYALPAGHQSTSLFFHYVPKNFEGNLT